MPFLALPPTSPAGSVSYCQYWCLLFGLNGSPLLGFNAFGAAQACAATNTAAQDGSGLMNNDG
jgi:hypothetical protein